MTALAVFTLAERMMKDLGMRHLKRLAGRFKDELSLYRRILADPQTPRSTRWLLGAAVAYAVSPIDLIPDFIPVLGHVDDVILLPLLVWAALRALPDELIAKHRNQMRAGQASKSDVRPRLMTDVE